LRSEALPQRLLFNELFQLADELAGRAELEVGVDALLERRHPGLLQAADLVAGERLEREVLERRPPPERQRGAQLLGPLVRRGATRFRGQALKAREVESLGVDAQDVAGRLRDDQLCADRLAEPRDVVLQRRARRLRWLRPPDLVDQPVGRDDLVRVQQQVGEEGAQPLSVQRDGAAVLDDRQWAENAEFDGNVAVLALARPDEQGVAVRGRLEREATVGR
jgi:hypothetical protein